MPAGNGLPASALPLHLKKYPSTNHHKRVNPFGKTTPSCRRPDGDSGCAVPGEPPPPSGASATSGSSWADSPKGAEEQSHDSLSLPEKLQAGQGPLDTECSAEGTSPHHRSGDLRPGLPGTQGECREQRFHCPENMFAFVLLVAKNARVTWERLGMQPRNFICKQNCVSGDY